MKARDIEMLNALCVGQNSKKTIYNDGCCTTASRVWLPANGGSGIDYGSNARELERLMAVLGNLMPAVKVAAE